MSTIKLLPEQMQRRIRSEYFIDSVCSSVQQLVYNSVEAKAHSVVVRLDLDFFNIQVADNGQGIEHTDMKLIGERYVTSKQTDELFSRGQTLASVISMSSQLQIDSKRKGQCYSKLFNGQKSRLFCSTSSAVETAEGTIVTVRNFLHSLPVRRGLVDGPLEMDKIKKILEEIALVNPSVAFSLHDDVNNVWLLKAPSFSSSEEAFSQFHGSWWKSRLRLLNGCLGPFEVSGFVAVNEGYRNKSLQFIYVRQRRVDDVELQHLVIKCFHNVLATPENSFPVFLLRVQCPMKHCTFSSHCSTRMTVEFHPFQTLAKLIQEQILPLIRCEDKTDAKPAKIEIKPGRSLCSSGPLFHTDCVLPSQTSVVSAKRKQQQSPLASFSVKLARQQRLANAVNDLAKYSRRCGLQVLTPLITENPLVLETKKCEVAIDVLPARPWSKNLAWDSSSDCCKTMTHFPHLAPSPLTTNSPSSSSTSTFQQFNLTKSHLQNVKVIGKVDVRFITAVCSCESGGSQQILIFDQHAIHERILLEQFTKDTLNSSQLDTALTLRLGESETTLVMSNLSTFRRLGIHFQLHNGLLEVTAVPQCFANKEQNKLKLKQTSVLHTLIQNTVDDIIQSLLMTGITGSAVPNTIVQLLRSQACHAAIKFGEHVTLEECKQLLKQLGKCDLPFQCAHGRPSVVPLIALPRYNSTTLMK